MAEELEDVLEQEIHGVVELLWRGRESGHRKEGEGGREGGTAKGETGGAARLRRTLKHREENIRDSRRTA